MDTRSRLHNALARVNVPELARHRLRPVLDQRGQPTMSSGDQAVVAWLRRSDGASRALRIPLAPDMGRSWPSQYGAIHDHLPGGEVAGLPDAIDVLDGGITLGNERFPAVLMEWIDGPTLLQAADRAATGDNAAVLRALAEALKYLAESLRQAQVAHGDLSADNLVVRVTGEVVAVDLDSLSWSGKTLGASGQTAPAYRFPSHRATGQQGDAFAVLVQYASLLALADTPDLRRVHGDPPATHGGAILFSSWDLTDPRTSRTFADVRARVSGETRRLIDLLRNACLGDAFSVPDIVASVFNAPSLSEAATETWSTPPTVPAAEPAESSQVTSTWDLSRVIDRIASQEKGFAQAVRKPEPEPSRATDQVTEDRARLREAIASGNDADVLRFAVRLADDPVAQLYRIDVERVLAVGYQRRIADAARHDRDDIVLQVAEEAETRNLPLSQASRRAIRNARERIDVRGKLQTALADNDRSALADLAVSGALVVLGDTDRESLQRVLQALEWPTMQRALESDDDTLILEAFDEELFGDETALPAQLRSRVVLAQERIVWVMDVRAALKQRNVDKLERLFSIRPNGGAERLSAAERKRADRLIQQQQALDSLETAIRTENDARILTALHEVERAGARIEDRVTWSSVRHVVERASLVERILDAANADPVDDRQLAHLLPVAETMGLMHDPAFHDDHAWDRLQSLVVRGAALRRIRNAIATDDDRAIVQATYPDVAGAVAMLTDEERVRVGAARTRPRS